MNNDLDELRTKLDDVNLQILELVNLRAAIVKQIGQIKNKQGIKRFDPVREREMLDQLIQHNNGPFDNSTIEHILKETFKAGLELIEDDHRKELLVSRKRQPENTGIDGKGEKVGHGKTHFVMGPCAVESYEQVREVAKAVKQNGIRLFRGGAFKPRTSPYDFQGLGIEGLQILRRVADEFDLAVISEIVNPAHIEIALDYVDV